MASTNERSPLISHHGNQNPRKSKLRSVVTGVPSEEDDLSSLTDVNITDTEQTDEGNKQLYTKFKRPSLGTHSSGTLGTSSGNTTASGDSKRRKPFHYSSVPTYVTDDGKIEHAVDEKTAATFNRYRYYSRLAGSPSQSDKALEIPDHVLPSFLLSVELPFKDKEGKQSSIVTIFSIWNTMMGTSLLSMPWAIQQAGFLMGLLLLIGMAGLTLYTCYRVVQSVQRLESGGKLMEFSDVCRAYLGRPGEFAAIFFSLAALLGAMIVYWVLMSNFMFSSVSFIYGHAAGLEDPENSSSVICALHKDNGDQVRNVNMTELADAEETIFGRIWSKTHTVPLFLCILVFPLMNFRSPTFFTKFNALGTLSVLYLIVFVCVQTGLFGGFHLDFGDPDSKFYAALVSARFPTFSGILALGYFIHMCISSILRTQKNPKNNGRDMTIAYILVGATYTFVGVMFYSSFPLSKDCLADNLLDNFSHGNVIAFTARLFLLFQMVTLFPLLVFIFRIQCLDPLFGSAYPSWKHVLGLNLILITIAVLFAVFLPQIGTIIRFSGAFCGLAYIFTLPCVVYMLELKQQNRLTWPVIVVHVCIIALGAANFLAQFVVLAM